MVKIDLITGFLGSGKTTFIREYAKSLLEDGEKVCILENDYGAVNIDMVLLQDLLGDNCNLEMIVGGDGQQAHARRFRTKLISMAMSGYTRVLIEPSGIYDVDEFFDVLYEEPLDRWYEIGSVISLVDCENVGTLKDYRRYIFMSEIACAGKLVLSKLSQGTDPKEVAELVNDIMTEYGGKPFDPDRDFIAKPFSDLGKRDFDSLKNAGYRHASYVKLPLEDKQFTPLFYFDVEMPEDKLREIVTNLFYSDIAGQIIRIKGFVGIKEGSQVELNATEQEIRIQPVISSKNVLIIIGERLNKEYINEILRDYCSVVSL